MIRSWLLLGMLAAPAAASLSGTAESRWNLIGLLPRRPDDGAVPQDPSAQLDAADAAAKAGDYERAACLYRLYLDACRPVVACAGELDRARLGMGLTAARLALPEDRDDAAAKEAVFWIEAIEDAGRRASAEPERLRMRALLGKKHLLVAGFYARRGVWNAAEARVETYAAEFPDAGGDDGIRRYLSDLRDMGRAAPEGERLAERAERLLSGGVPPAPDRTPSAAIAAAAPAAPSREKAPLAVSVDVFDGRPRALAAASGSWSVDVGELGVGGRSPLLGESPYVNVRRVTRSPLESGVGRRLELQAGVVDMTARYFGDDAVSPGDRLAAAARRLGVPEEALGPLRSRLTTDDPWKSELGFVAGSLLQYGRAFRLPFHLPVDLAWSATILGKTAHLAPNVAANASGGMRVTLPSGHEVALIGGWSEDLSPVGNGLLPELARGQGPKAGLYREGSPQAAAAVGGPVPGLPSVRLDLAASRRWTDAVAEQKVQAGLSSTISGKPVELRMSYKDESGPAIEYGRRGLAAEATLTFSPGASIYALCEKEKISYGGVDVANDGCLTGLRWTPGIGAKASVSTIFGGKDRLSTAGSTQAAALAASIGRLGAAGLEAADRIAAKAEPFEGLSAAAAVIANLPSGEQAAVRDALAAAPLSPRAREMISDLMNARVPDLTREYAAKRAPAVEAIGLLSDPGFWDGAAQAVVRREFLAAISELKVTLGPLGTLRVTPVSAIFMASAVRSHGSPLSPLTARDSELLRANVMSAVAKAVGASGNDARAVTGALIDRAQDAFAQSLETDVIARLTPLLNDRAAMAEKALAGLPPDTAARLRERLGPDLGLSGLDPVRVEAVLRALPEQAAADLRARAAPAAAEALNQALALAVQTLRREINRTVLQLLLASEELDRLTVDRGLKPGDLGARMISESFSRLDERNRRGLRARRSASIGRLAEALDAQGRELAEYASGRAADAVKALSSAAGWPAGLRVELDEASRAKLVEAYGEDALAAAIARLGARLPADAAADILVAYDAFDLGSTAYRGEDGRVRLTVGPPGRSVEFSLDTALNAAWEAAKRRTITGD